VSVSAQGRTEVLVAFVGHERCPVETHSQRADGYLGCGGFESAHESCSALCGAGKPRNCLSFSHHQRQVAEVQGRQHIPPRAKRHTLRPRNTS
jgi:hypothetical protein